MYDSFVGHSKISIIGYISLMEWHITKFFLDVIELVEDKIFRVLKIPKEK